MATLKLTGPPEAQTDNRLFTLDVFIIDGLVSDAFLEANPVVGRTIQIRADQTLEDLHLAIFDAFDREELCEYEFQLDGEGPEDPNAKRYVQPEAFLDEKEMGPPLGLDNSATDSVDVTIGSLGLQLEDIFGYLFDFDAEWWHQIKVIAIADKASKGKYPKVTQRIGASPPQFEDWDEEDEWELEEDDIYDDDDDDADLMEYDAPAHLEELKADVPEDRVERFMELVQLTDTFCAAHLNTQYQMICRVMLAGLCLQDVPLHKDKPQSWAAGILYIIGQVVFMIDPNCKLHMTPEDMAKQMGVSMATVRNKANIIRKAVEVDSHDAFGLTNDLPAFEAMDAYMDHLTPLPKRDDKKRKH